MLRGKYTRDTEFPEDFLKTLRFWSDRGVDGFRIDVAHALMKDLSEPLPSKAELPVEGTGIDGLVDGSHPFWDRDDVHEIYAEWRKVSNEYTLPRTAVAEAWVHADRRARYASPEGLGQAFNFDLLQADFDARQFYSIITKNLAEAAATGASSTQVFSNHDVIRHATRYGLPARGGRHGQGWLLEGSSPSAVDVEVGLRRTRAAFLLMFPLPGSAYLYQGEELGLQEVGDIPASDRQDPAFFRNPGVDIGRDGCRVPLPWTTEGVAFGFGGAAAHLPQPEWFSGYAVEVQDGTEGSTLELYRAALRLRSSLQTEEPLKWLSHPDDSVGDTGTRGIEQPRTDEASRLDKGFLCEAGCRPGWVDAEPDSGAALVDAVASACDDGGCFSCRFRGSQQAGADRSLLPQIGFRPRSGRTNGTNAPIPSVAGVFSRRPRIRLRRVM